LARQDTKPKLGNRRVTGKEQFYTPPETAAAVVERLLAVRADAAGRVWIEPAGGTGAFVEAAAAAGVDEILSFDIEPHHPRVAPGNFLEQELSVRGAVAAGNPPFGRNNALSIPFFNRSADYCEIICFVVPRSWRKWSVINRLDGRFGLIDDYDLGIDYVDVGGQPCSDRGNLRTCVQTWARQAERRPKVVIEDRGVIAKTTPAEADVSLTIFGYSCGTVKTEFERKPNTTQMFLRLVHPDALEALRSVDFSRFFNNTAYTEALSLPEISCLLNEFIFGDSGRAGVATTQRGEPDFVEHHWVPVRGHGPHQGTASDGGRIRSSS